MSEISKERLEEWENADVQRIYAILCDDLEHKPKDEHWEGYCARWIAGELISPLRAELLAARKDLERLRTIVDKVASIHDGRPHNKWVRELGRMARKAIFPQEAK